MTQNALHPEPRAEAAGQRPGGERAEHAPSIGSSEHAPVATRARYSGYAA